MSSADAPGSAPPARVWVTTPDGRLRLAEQAPVPFSSSPPRQLTVSIDPARRFQPMEGFGASISDSSAAVLYRLDRATRDAVMTSLFDPRVGNGLGVLRQPILHLSSDGHRWGDAVASGAGGGPAHHDRDRATGRPEK